MTKATAAVFLTLALTGCGGARPDTSAPSSIIGTPDLQVLTTAAVAADAAARGVGSLMVVLEDPDVPGDTFAVPNCTGIQISRRHVLTAAHCDRDGYIFNTKRIAMDADVANYSFEAFGNTLRLVFGGEFVPESAAAEKQTPTHAAVFKDTVLDFAILQFDYDLGGTPVSLTAPLPKNGGLALYGYPNGMPLTKADHCTGNTDDAADAARMRHDCDSLTGSSGGLIADAATGTPVAMQLSGPAANRADYYREHGTFETPEDFAMQRGCQREQADFADCVRARGLNGAVRFTQIVNTLAVKDPALLAAIGGLTGARSPAPLGE